MPTFTFTLPGTAGDSPIAVPTLIAILDISSALHILWLRDR
jgi:hypothetical protein